MKTDDSWHPFAKKPDLTREFDGRVQPRKTRFTPPTCNIALEKGWSEDYFAFGTETFQGAMLKLWGCSLISGGKNQTV